MFFFRMVFLVGLLCRRQFLEQFGFGRNWLRINLCICLRATQIHLIYQRRWIFKVDIIFPISTLSPCCVSFHPFLHHPQIPIRIIRASCARKDIPILVLPPLPFSDITSSIFFPKKVGQWVTIYCLSRNPFWTSSTYSGKNNLSFVCTYGPC